MASVNSAKAAEKWQKLMNMSQEFYSDIASGNVSPEVLSGVESILTQQSFLSYRVFSNAITSIQAAANDIAILLTAKDARYSKDVVTKEAFKVLFEKYQDELFNRVYNAIKESSDTKNLKKDIFTNISPVQEIVNKSYNLISNIYDTIQNQYSRRDSSNFAVSVSKPNNTFGLAKREEDTFLRSRDTTKPKKRNKDGIDYDIILDYYKNSKGLSEKIVESLEKLSNTNILPFGNIMASMLKNNFLVKSRLDRAVVQGKLEDLKQKTIIDDDGNYRKLNQKEIAEQLAKFREEYEKDKKSNPKKYAQLRKQYLTKYFKKYNKTFGDLFEGTSNLLRSIKSSIPSGLSFLKDALLTVAGTAIAWPIIRDNIIPLITNNLPDVTKALKDYIKGDGLKNDFSSLIDKIVEKFPDTWEKVSDIVTTVFDAVGTMSGVLLEKIWNGIKNFLGLGDTEDVAKKKEQIKPLSDRVEKLTAEAGAEEDPVHKKELEKERDKARSELQKASDLNIRLKKSKKLIATDSYFATDDLRPYIEEAEKSGNWLPVAEQIPDKYRTPQAKMAIQTKDPSYLDPKSDVNRRVGKASDKRNAPAVNNTYENDDTGIAQQTVESLGVSSKNPVSNPIPNTTSVQQEPLKISKETEVSNTPEIPNKASTPSGSSSPQTGGLNAKTFPSVSVGRPSGDLTISSTGILGGESY